MPKNKRQTTHKSKVNIAAMLLILFLALQSTGIARAQSVTYEKDIRPIVQSKCLNCHGKESLSFPLDTYEALYSLRLPASDAIYQRRMPPWLAAPGHKEYRDDFSLSEKEIEIWRKWQKNKFSKGEKPGNSNQEKPIVIDIPFEGNFKLDLFPGEKKYFPDEKLNDDYRCFLIDWPFKEKKYIKGVRFETSLKTLLHHSVVFVAKPEIAKILREYDDYDKGVGYRCFGSQLPDKMWERENPGKMSLKTLRYKTYLLSQSHWLAVWTPSNRGYSFDGSGIPMNPDSLIVVQAHINNKQTNTPVDDIVLNFKLADQVESPGIYTILTDWNWFGEHEKNTLHVLPGKEHTVKVSVPLPLLFNELIRQVGEGKSYSALRIHSSSLHMHRYGIGGEIRIDNYFNKAPNILLNVPRWDLNWQFDFMLTEPLVFNKTQMLGKSLTLECNYFNPGTEAVWGGNGTLDEMCMNFGYYSLVPEE